MKINELMEQRISINRETCNACGLCEDICPNLLNFEKLTSANDHANHWKTRHFRHV
jgi:formate hydrogenlyase subunit 6/NADH:ubiquinone oxidoreductase subunit I